MTPIHNQQQQKKVSKTNFWVFLVTAYNTREEESKKKHFNCIRERERNPVQSSKNDDKRDGRRGEARRYGAIQRTETRK